MIASDFLSNRVISLKKLFNKVEWSWIFYDWANSIWATNIAAAIFPIYFASKASATGNVVYGYAVSIAKLVVELMGGEIGVQSQLGQGSRFFFSLPKQK